VQHPELRSYWELPTSNLICSVNKKQSIPDCTTDMVHITEKSMKEILEML
jgi:hypothetical protein